MNIWILSLLVFVCVVMNLVLIGITTYFFRKSSDKASKIGFSFMDLTFLYSILMVLGGVFLW